MFAKSALVAFLAFALTAEAIPKQGQRFQQQQCAAPSTVTNVQTVTVTAGTAPTQTSRVLTGGNNNNNNNNNAGTNTKATTSAALGSKTTAAAAAGGAGSKTTSAALGSQTTAAAGGNKAGNNAAGGKGNTGTGGKGNNAGNAGGNTGNAGGNTGNAGGNTGNAGGNTGNTGNPQTSTTLDPKVIASGFANDGQDVPTAGQVASLTSTNNFINFCLTVPNLPITNGKQITTGSCNPAPIGTIPSVDNMPSSKFTFPANFGTIKANTDFTISMAIKNMQTGFFVNAQENYFSAPQQLNGAGQIQGHSHVVIEQLTSLTQANPTDPKKFVFFKGLNAAAQGGILTADVTGGLAAGVYKLSSINSSSNHQPVIVPIAQHGSLDDAIYFTVTADGNAAAGSTGIIDRNGANGGIAKAGANTGANTGANNNKGGNTNKGGRGRRALNRLS